MLGIQVPFVPNVVEENVETLVEAELEGFEGSGLPGYEERPNLLHFHGRCHVTHMNPSRLLRAHIADALQGDGNDVHVSLKSLSSTLTIYVASTEGFPNFPRAHLAFPVGIIH